jgi:hypothetical protein
LIAWQINRLCAGFVGLLADEALARKRGGSGVVGLERTALGELEAAF